MLLHNEYFCNAVEEQNKAAELVSYIFPTPLNTNLTYVDSTIRKCH